MGFLVLGIEPRILHTLGSHSTPELHLPALDMDFEDSFGGDKRGKKIPGLVFSRTLKRSEQEGSR